MAHLPSEFVSHSQKVCRLYKKVQRSLADYLHKTHDYRYQATLMRDRFDKNKNIKDLRYAKYLLEQGEEEVFHWQHWRPIKFANSATGSAYKREVDIEDCLLDCWDPLEKARYPKYFARREQMKKEYEEWYFKTYPDMKN